LTASGVLTTRHDNSRQEVRLWRWRARHTCLAAATAETPQLRLLLVNNPQPAALRVLLFARHNRLFSAQIEFFCHG
jgi:hypothetical protein